MRYQKYFFLLLFVAGSSVISAQETNKDSLSAQIKTREDSVQYALGIYIGQWILNNGFTTFSPNLFLTGVYDIIRNRPRQIKDSTALTMINNYQRDLYLNQSKKFEEDLFESLKGQSDVNTLANGVKYRIRREGKGIKPQVQDSVVIQFKGTLLDGTVFEDTYTRKLFVATTPANLFPGLTDALQHMPEGSLWELYIPASLAYGDKGNGGNIPPKNALIILLELVAVKRNS